MSFNPDRSKQTQDVIFSRKIPIQSHPVLTFDNSTVIKTTDHKHLGLILDEKLNFKEHLSFKHLNFKEFTNSTGLNLLTLPRLSFSHLNNHKFNHNF